MLAVVILDGWGISFVEAGNAVAAAETPNMDNFAAHYPAAVIAAAGQEVGLPWGEVGNSETGHKNIGAGNVQYQVLEAINRAIDSKSFFKNEVLLATFDHAKKHSSSLHLMGLVSPGGVHSHMRHLYALLRLAAKREMRERVYIHMFTDGRDTPPRAALSYLKQLEDKIGETGVGTIASVTGRFYAMDRNENWERTQAAFDMLTGKARAAGAPNARKAIENAYAENISDEVIPPTAITRGGDAMTYIRDNDAVIFFNFRPDRARQLTRIFLERGPRNVFLSTLTRYDPGLQATAAFVEEAAEMPLAKVISEAGLRQTHIAETEKYAHVTYYLNAGHEKPFPGEEHVLIESSRVKNFADEPAMSAEQITDRAIFEIEQGKADVLFINYANPDMVGHTGDFKATATACAFVDAQLGRLSQALSKAGGAMLVTADHGNAEEMQNPQTGEIETDHTANPVPFYYVSERLRRTTPKNEAEVREILSSPIGVLADVAPTVLEILHIKKPPQQMTGVSLLNSLR